MKPKTYSKQTHGIQLSQIDPKALYILEKLRLANHTAYLVGGSVRDLLLKKKPKDFDISTSAKPEEIKALFRNCILIGKRFRLAHIRFGKKVIEVSTFRSGNIQTDQLITEDNMWGTPEEDALRRDFTINGLFFDSATECIIDFVEGYPDIQKQYLRAIGNPYRRFKQDPVRMIRLIKFQARFGLEIDQEAQLALLDCKKEIVKSAQARILEELLRMLESGSAYPFFKLMTDHGLLQHLLPASAQFLERQEGHSLYSFLQEADHVLLEPNHFPLDRPVLLACLLYPILDTHLKTHFLDRGKTPHLGDIHQEAITLIDKVFSPFFRLPKRLRTGAISTLVSQYRMTPFMKRKNQRKRIPKTADFHFSLQFLALRCRLEPGLQEIEKEWNTLFDRIKTSSPQKIPTKRKKPRKRLLKK